MKKATVSSYIALGKIRSPWGLKGELRFTLYHPASELLFKTRRVYLKAGLSFQETALLSARRHGKDLLIRLEGFHSPEGARSLKGEELFYPVEELPKSQEGEFYCFELVGMEVFNEKGDLLGRVKEVMSFGASEILAVTPSKAGKGEYLVPLIAEVVKKISREGKKIYIQSLEGLLE